MEIRNIYIDKFNKILDLEKSKELEKHLFNYVKDYSVKNGFIGNINNNFFFNYYKKKFISIISNIDKNSYINNKKLCNNIVKNKIDLKKLVSMSHVQLFKQRWENCIKNQALLDKEIILSLSLS